MSGLKDGSFRHVWEGQCSVEGCEQIFRLEGTWGCNPNTPRWFYTSSDRDGNLPGGWVYWHRSCIPYELRIILERSNVKSPAMFDRFLFCPEHASPWKGYLSLLWAWAQLVRDARKKHWLCFFTRWHGSPPPIPESPFTNSGKTS